MNERTETFGLEENRHAPRTGGTDVRGYDRDESNVRSHGHEGDGSNDHLASIYGDQDEQFASVVPFVREGLERGERCIYLADENATEAVESALRSGGVDVDAALGSDSLSILTNTDAAIGDGRFVPEFDLETQIEFWEESLAEATVEQGYDGVRVAVEMTWVLDGGTGLDRLVEYEAMLNAVFSGEAYTVLCQYRRDRFPPGVLSDVIRTHPLVVCNNTVCRSAYYSPPEEFLDAAADSQDVDRMVEGLLSRTRAQRLLQEREHGLAALADVTRESMYATPEEVGELVTEAAHDVLETTVTGVWLADDEGDLRLCAVNGRGADEDALAERCGDLARQAFADGESAIYNDLERRESDTESATALRSGAFLPLGERGLFLAASSRENAFDAADVDFAKTVATNTEAILDRAARERALRERERKLKQFASVVSHDLRNPLSIAQMYLEMARNEGEPEDLQRVEDALERMETIIRNLLMMAGSGRTITGTESVSLRTVVESAWADVDTAEADLRILDSGTVVADADRLQTAFENLFRNSVEHGGTDVEVRVGRLADGFYLEDTGPGIPDEHRDDVFDYGYSSSGGTGIGLAVVREIVEAHGWTITAADPADDGVRFEVHDVTDSS